MFYTPREGRTVQAQVNHYCSKCNRTIWEKEFYWTETKCSDGVYKTRATCVDCMKNYSMITGKRYEKD